jgi:hypothetical protein
MTVLDAPSSDLAAAIVGCFGPAVSKHTLGRDSLYIKFHGYPWNASGTETVDTRIMLLQLMEVLEKFGFSLYASIDHQESQYGADVLYLHRQKDWLPGAPVWHR